MNVTVAARVTRATEGLPRRPFTVADVEAMVAAGMILREDERVELIRGELVLMPPKGNHQEVVKVALLRRRYPIVPAALVNLENIGSCRFSKKVV